MTIDLAPVLDAYPSDKANFPTILTAADRRAVLSMEPCQPPELQQYYSLKQSNGIELKRSWLCFSPKLKQAYCVNCWLFARVNTPWATGVPHQKREGWLRRIEEHEKSACHKEAQRSRLQFSKAPIDGAIQQAIEDEENKCAAIISRVIDVLLACADMNIGLRGHREKIGDGQCEGGNFLAMIKLLSKYDPLLKEIINSPKNSQRYLSPTIQNELLGILGEECRRSLVTKILKSPYFSLLLDSTQDITKVDQLSIVVRWVSVAGEEVKIEESFLGFVPMNSGTAQVIADTALDLLNELGFSLDKLRGQGYDGASVMSGIYSGVQKLIADKTTSPTPFVHCSTHNLNLVVQDFVKDNNHMTDFFNTLTQLYSFVGASHLRWNALKLDGDGLTVKKLCPTRWSSRFSSIRAVKDKQGAINRLLTKIVLMRQEGRDVAEGLLKRIRSFEFTATLVVWENILNKVDKVSNMLQTKDLDLAAVTTSLKSLVDHLTLLESDESFDTMMKTARAQAKLAGAEEDFTLSMARNLYRYTGRARHDGCDEPVSKEEIFKASVYLHSLRRCKEQAKLRFEGHFKVVNSFRCLLPKLISSCKLNDFREECVKLQSLYNKDLSSDFVEQLLDLKTDLREELLTASHSKELLELIFERQLQTLYPEVVTGLVLFLTLPVTVASAERSFSKLKLIKTYLRSTMSQDCLRHFALLSIEHKEAGKLDKSLIIKKFASAKVRRSKRFNVKLDL
ncbi:hypothetical protein ACHWQZ_G012406 [Mnemiopsis leidyi]